MRNITVKLLCLGFVLGLGAAPAMAQDAARANTLEDFQSADADDGVLGSGMDIWDFFHNSGRLSGAGSIDESFYRSQSRQINRQVDSFRELQRQRLEQSSTERAVDGEVVAE